MTPQFAARILWTAEAAYRPLQRNICSCRSQGEHKTDSKLAQIYVSWFGISREAMVGVRAGAAASILRMLLGRAPGKQACGVRNAAFAGSEPTSSHWHN